MAETLANRSALAGQLQAIAARCSPPDGAALPGGQLAESPSTLAELAVTRMATAVAVLRQQDATNRQGQQ
jgi:hypothetical protein